jgi:hypothetical protein
MIPVRNKLLREMSDMVYPSVGLLNQNLPNDLNLARMKPGLRFAVGNAEL